MLRSAARLPDPLVGLGEGLDRLLDLVADDFAVGLRPGPAQSFFLSCLVGAPVIYNRRADCGDRPGMEHLRILPLMGVGQLLTGRQGTWYAHGLLPRDREDRARPFSSVLLACHAA